MEYEKVRGGTAFIGWGRYSRWWVPIESLILLKFLVNLALYPPAIKGFQEALQRQVKDLLELLPLGGGEWGYVCQLLFLY